MLIEIIYPSAGSMAFGKAVCPPIKTTVDIYTSIQISPVHLSLNFCVLLILLLSSDTRKPTRSVKVEANTLYLQGDNAFFTWGCHITPSPQTSSNNLS